MPPPAVNGSGFNDKARLADAIALARSFSKSLPPRPRKRSRSRGPPQGHGRQLRSAGRQQLTQSILRPGLKTSAPSTNHRQPPQRRPPPKSKTVNVWHGQKELPSITGGRGLDFLSRKDAAPPSKPVVEPAAPVKVEAPTADSTPIAPVTSNIPDNPSARATQSSVLDTYYALMSQQQKDEEQFDPLMEKIKQWKLDSPTGAKPRLVVMPDRPAHKDISDMKINSATEFKPDMKGKAVNQGEPGRMGLRVKETPISRDSSVVNGSLATKALPKKMEACTKENIKPLVDTNPPEQKVNEAATEIIPDIRSPAPDKIIVRLPPTPPQEIVPKSPAKMITLSPAAPKNPEPVKCNCKPVVKQAKGLASSRFASEARKKATSPGTFAAASQVITHAGSCPLSTKRDSEYKQTGRTAQKLRANAAPFTPTARSKLIMNPESYTI